MKQSSFFCMYPVPQVLCYFNILHIYIYISFFSFYIVFFNYFMLFQLFFNYSAILNSMLRQLFSINFIYFLLIKLLVSDIFQAQFTFTASFSVFDYFSTNCSYFSQKISKCYLIFFSIS